MILYPNQFGSIFTWFKYQIGPGSFHQIAFWIFFLQNGLGEREKIVVKSTTEHIWTFLLRTVVSPFRLCLLFKYSVKLALSFLLLLTGSHNYRDRYSDSIQKHRFSTVGRAITSTEISLTHTSYKKVTHFAHSFGFVCVCIIMKSNTYTRHTQHELSIEE